MSKVIKHLYNPILQQIFTMWLSSFNTLSISLIYSSNIFTFTIVQFVKKKKLIKYINRIKNKKKAESYAEINHKTNSFTGVYRCDCILCQNFSIKK